MTRDITGSVLWITGLSGAGKTTIAHRVWATLRARGVPAIYLDGDVLRAMLGAVEAHSLEQRRALAHTYGRICAELAGQGFTVICATISMFHDVRRWNRGHLPGYQEVYLRVPVAELTRRDAKGLYARAAQGTGNMMGLDLPIEEPLAPDLIIDNFGATDVDAAERLILTLFDKEASL
jgi:adenylylsulfate kinase